ncbi:HpcH/HpaI aldolase/citrate lyase family protein [uncultured Prochlorococcus sp.]|uniref:HpcH/HpaI aldolase family protein n=1 Tax=uncultured Prochlorococcus sp. TaxID=159733 RepID=UPI002590B271|nr:aldolase/citrate lyase family protein [uncultured Prochlorococcus sp.]
MTFSIKELRLSIKDNQPSVGTWMQIPSPEVAEILSSTNYYDWIVIDLEHGSFSRNELPSIIRAVELNKVLPFVRLQSSNYTSLKEIVDCGFSGYIVPMIESPSQLETIYDQITYPPKGKRGVGFSRSNQYGLNFKEKVENQIQPFLVAMIETQNGLENIEKILDFKNLDAVIIGPYDLSASLNICGQFDNEIFIKAFDYIIDACKRKGIPFGTHLIEPCNKKLKEIIKKGSRFIPFSIDTVMLYQNKPLF